MLVEIMKFLVLEVSFFVTIIIINWQLIKKSLKMLSVQ